MSHFSDIDISIKEGRIVSEAERTGAYVRGQKPSPCQHQRPLPPIVPLRTVQKLRITETCNTCQCSVTYSYPFDLTNNRAEYDQVKAWKDAHFTYRGHDTTNHAEAIK